MEKRAEWEFRELELSVLQHWAVDTFQRDEQLGPRSRLRAHFLAKAFKCYRAAASAQHPRAQNGFTKTAQRWEAMAYKAEADDAAEAATAETA